MAQLKDNLENALNEGRILMLGVQVLVGLDYRAVFEEGFARLAPVMQRLKLASLAMMLLCLALLFAPIPFHWVVGRGQRPRALYGFAQAVIGWALLPFAVALAIDVVIASSRVWPATPSSLLGAATLGTALLFWYGIEFSQQKGGMMDKNPEDEAISLRGRVKEVLVETRIALPGVQATLGFQFIIVLVTGFELLPRSLQVVHLASLMCSAVCVVLLIAPAAYHRLAEGGEDSERFLRFAGTMVLLALVPLAMALSGDVVVVVWKVTDSMQAAVFGGAAALIGMLGFWFGYMSWRRREVVG